MERQRAVVASLGARGDDDRAADGVVGLSRGLWSQGWEVIHLGNDVTADAVAAVAVQEDADEVVLAGDVADVTRVVEALERLGESEITVRSAR